MAKPKFLGVIAGVCAALIFGFGCSTDTQTPMDSSSNQTSKIGAITSTGPYTVTLEDVVDNGDGTWTWIWSVMNPHPGNGKAGTGTAQDMSHWTTDLGSCADIDNIVGAATSPDGSTWTAFTPTWGVDPSMCNTCALNCNTNVLKFALGTLGGAKSWYSLTVDTEYEPAEVTAYYKSGSRTGCGTFTYEGIGCPPEDDPGPQCTATQCEGNTSNYVMSDPTITDNGNGTWTWEWSITNTNPGNGTGGTTQGLSHFDMPFNTCLENCTESEDFLVSAAYKQGGAADWTTFAPDFATDPSLGNTGCTTYADGIYLKFQVGTTGNTPTLLRLTVNEDLSPQTQIGVWKSGNTTGCGCLNFKGLGCNN